MAEDEQPTDDNLANAALIKEVDATEQGARGNVHSEADDTPQHDAPPPLPN